MATQNTEVSIVVLGDSNTGKSSFLFRWETDLFRETSRSHSLEHKSEVTVDGKSATTSVLCIDPDRPLLSSSLAKADIFLLTFSVISPKSLENIKTKWILEVEQFTPKTHCVLIGLKHDRRGVENRERDEIEISVQSALQVARDIGAVGYYETSAVTGAGVNETIEFCVRTVLKLNTSENVQLTFSTNTNGPIQLPSPKLQPTEDAPSTVTPGEEVRVKEDERSAGNNSEDTPLSLACVSGQLDRVKYLVKNNHCDPTKPARKNSDTPIFLAYKGGHWEVVKYLANTHHCDTKDCLLHAVEHDNISGVKFLLDECRSDPNVKNKQGKTPLSLTENPEVMILLLNHGAKTDSVYKSHSKLVGKLSSERPPDSPQHIFITGDPGVGKSTMLKSMLSSKGIGAFFVKANPVTGVNEKTLGIVPHDIMTKEFGRVIIYEFAGQQKFYASYGAILKNAVQTSPPIIIHLAHLQASEQKIADSTAWWMTLIQNQCTNMTGRAHVIVVGSHADKIIERGKSPQEKEGVFAPILDNFSKFEFTAFISIDCRYPNSDQMKEVKKHIQKSTTILRSPETINQNAHTFYIYLLDNFKDNLAVSLKDVQHRIQVDLSQNLTQSQSKRAKHILSFIPSTFSQLVEVCDQLNKKGLILYLHNEASPENSFIVYDSVTLFSRITDAVFVQDSFYQYCSLATNTGVVPLFKFAEQFKEYDIQMLIAFITHMELCYEIRDQEVLVQIEKILDKKSNSYFPPDPDGHYLFFPGIIQINTPEIIWEEARGRFAYHFGWILQCSQDVKFFDSHCLQALILRIVLTFHFAPATGIKEHIPSLQRFCSVWKNGICWINEDGVTAHLELSDNEKALILKLRSHILRPACLRTRSNVITKVLQTVKDVYPDTKTVESIIDPQEVIVLPLKPPSELTLYCISDIAKAITTKKEDDKSDYKSLPLKHLLAFEPYANLNQDTLQCILSDKNTKKDETLSSAFISHFTDQVTNCSEDLSEYIALISHAQVLSVQSSHTGSPRQKLIQALITWRNETEGTYSCLRETLNKYSIFTGRNPLNLAGVAHNEFDSSIFSEPPPEDFQLGHSQIREPELVLLKKVLQITSEKQSEPIVHIQEFLTDKKDVTYEELEVKLDRSQKTSYLSNNLRGKLEQRVEEEQLYQEAMAYGKPVSLLYLKVLAIGPGQVGKTTFIRRLTGQMQWDIDTAQQESLPQGSTGQAEMQEVHIEYNKETVTIDLGLSKWDILEESKLEEHISSLIALLSHQGTNTGSGPEISEAQSIASAKHLSSGPGQAHSDNITVSDSEGEQLAQESEEQTLISKQEKEAAILNSQQLPKEEKLQLQLPPPTKIKKVLAEFQRLRKKRRSRADSTTTLHAIINLADIGGQPAFLEMLPSLTVGPAMFLIFMKITEGLKTPYPVRFWCEGNQSLTEHKEHMYTYEEIIFTALSSIACFGNLDEEVEWCISDKVASKRTNSLALLMGTFADALKDCEKDSNIKNEVSQMEQQLMEQLKVTKFFKDDLIAFSDSKEGEALFRIDNKSGGEAEVMNYRQLLETFMQKYFKKLNIPTPWLMFSICIKILAFQEGKQVVSFDDCVEIGKQLNMSEQKVTVALKFLHKYVGLVMFFPGNEFLKNIVICDPQAVFSSISELIFNVYDPKKRTISDSTYTQFVEKGQFAIEDINLDTKEGKNLLPIDTLVKLLVHLHIAVPIPSSSTYFLPAVLKTATVDSLALDAATASNNPEPLCITFRTGYLPLGFVCALVANLISEDNFELLGKEQGEVIYRNKVKFRFRGIYDIEVISWPKFCEFRVSRCSQIFEEFHSSEACPLIRSTIVKAIDHVIGVMRQSSLFQFSKDYRLAFRCRDPKQSVVTPVEGLGHEGMAVVYGDNPNDPKSITCMSCKKLHPLTTKMAVWFREALTMTKQPTAPAEGAHIPCGGDLTLSVSASGVQPLYYQWIRNGEKLQSSTCYQGCTSPSLHIKGNKGYLKGVYWCQVKDKYGSTLCSDKTDVTVELEFSAAMTCDDVCDWLKQNNLSDDDILHFRKQKVDGETFLYLSSKSDYEHLFHNNLTLGATTKLNKLMKAVCKGPTVAERLRKEFSAAMTCDDVCDWLKQNNLSDEDILPFRKQKVDGETFLDLSSKSDYEHLLHHDFTLGAKTKLNKLMKAICKSPYDAAVTERLRKLISINAFWDLRAKWDDLALELNITQGACEAIERDHPKNSAQCFRAALLEWLEGPSEPEISDLLKALRSNTVDRYDVAEEVEASVSQSPW